MSTKNKEIKPTLPIIIEEETSKGDIPKGLSLYLISFKWMKREFVNLNDGSEVKIKFWTKGGNVFLTPVLSAGRHILHHGTEQKHYTNAKGEIIETKTFNKTKIIGREYGFKALASILSAIFPCTIEKAKELVKEALDKRIAHAKLVLRSDLCPTSPDMYAKMGLENGWVMISDYPDTESIEASVNAVLKAQNSPLRAKFALRWKLVD